MAGLGGYRGAPLRLPVAMGLRLQWNDGITCCSDLGGGHVCCGWDMWGCASGFVLCFSRSCCCSSSDGGGVGGWHFHQGDWRGDCDGIGNASLNTVRCTLRRGGRRGGVGDQRKFIRRLRLRGRPAVLWHGRHGIRRCMRRRARGARPRHVDVMRGGFFRNILDGTSCALCCWRRLLGASGNGRR